jgi:hypothetical protein
VRPLPPRPYLFATLAFVFASQVQALTVRKYNNAVHRRMDWRYPKILSGATPLPNPNFIADANLLRAIGWPEIPNDFVRQLALVSPRHLLFATHYALDPAWPIGFSDADGKLHLHRIESQTPIRNVQGQQTDLMLVTLTASVDTTVGITPFPVLNLSTEADYLGKTLLISGSVTDSGTGTIGGHKTQTNDPGLDTTRFIYFDYDKNATGKPNDCTYSYGDSGSPGFVMINGRPALVGTASSFDDLTPNDGIEGPVFRNYMASIHTYFPQVDAIMETNGYHLKRFYPEVTTLGTTVSATSALHQMKPGSVSIAATNSGAQAAHNVELVITFPTAPTTISGPGWICDAVTPLVWKCRRGGISSARSSSLIASWNNLPATGTLAISIVRSYDGSAPATATTSLPLTPN